MFHEYGVYGTLNKWKAAILYLILFCLRSQAPKFQCMKYAIKNRYDQNCDTNHHKGHVESRVN
jgi:hypothetical protein